MYHVDQEEKMLGIFEAIASEEIDDTPYNIVKNPKPVVESVMLFDDATVDFSKWSAGNGVDSTAKKVGKAKTAPTKKVEPVTENDSTDDKKSDGKVVVMNTKIDAKASEAPKAGNGGSFDNAAKSAKTSNQSDASKNKHFEQKQRKLNDLFREHVKSLMVDEKSTKDCEKILKKFDEITSRIGKKTLTEAVAGHPLLQGIPAYAIDMITDYIRDTYNFGDETHWVENPEDISDIYNKCCDEFGQFDDTKLPTAASDYINKVDHSNASVNDETVFAEGTVPSIKEDVAVGV